MSVCWFCTLKVVESFFRASGQRKLTDQHSHPLSVQVFADVKMLRAISSLQMIFSTFLTFLQCLCSLLNCTDLLRVGSDGGDELSQTRPEERAIKMWIEFLTTAGDGCELIPRLIVLHFFFQLKECFGEIR